MSRPMEEIIAECRMSVAEGKTYITLVGQNVNSYGADLITNNAVQALRDIPDKTYFEHAKEYHHDEKYAYNGKNIRPVYVKHLGRLRIPTLFPLLLKEIAKIKGIELIDFISSNPWDFSDELIEVMAQTPKISRHLHLPVQAGDDTVLKRMNRWYTRDEYISLVKTLKEKIPEVTIGTDIIVGFPGETVEQFEQTVALAKEVGFTKAYVAMYSDRPMTAAHKAYLDDVSYKEKKRRWAILEELINQTNLRQGTYTKAK